MRKYCSCCGRLVEIGGMLLDQYETRWFMCEVLTLCSDCHRFYPPQTDRDVPTEIILSKEE